MNAQRMSRIEPTAVSVEFVVASEDEDWLGVNDCGAVDQSASPLEPGIPAIDDDWWPGHCVP